MKQAGAALPTAPGPTGSAPLFTGPKVFGVGFNKTGTTSLKRAFERLGLLPVSSVDLSNRAGLIDAIFDRRDFEPALRYARWFRAFEDRPWNIWDMYRRLDERYPGSLFVLTVRDPEPWWRSVHRWISLVKPHMAERYRTHLQAESLREADMIDAYQRYNDAVRRHFAGRSELLILDVEKGDGWTALCEHLGLPEPDEPFPHTNRQQHGEGPRGDRRRYDHRATSADALMGIETTISLANCPRCHRPLAPTPSRWRRLLQASAAEAGKRLFRSLQRRTFVPDESPDEAVGRVAELRRRHPRLTIDDFAVVTCYVSPCGYQTRRRNYSRFRQGIEACGLPLLTVELAIGDEPFQLADEPGEILRLRARDALWQKERLLNLGIRALLDRGFRKIAWLDADIVFDAPQAWPWAVAAELERTPLCQVFGQVLVEQDRGRTLLPGVSAVRYFRDTGDPWSLARRWPSLRRPFGYPLGYSGYGWAAHADLLSKVELYDAAVVGGGDKLIYAASLPIDDRWAEEAERLVTSSVSRCPGCAHRNESPAMTKHFLEWAERWAAIVGGRVGSTQETIRSLYHGDRQHRSYLPRREILLRHGFEPLDDLVLDDSECWRWASAKPDLHLQVASYFFERREDS